MTRKRIKSRSNGVRRVSFPVQTRRTYPAGEGQDQGPRTKLRHKKPEQRCHECACQLCPCKPGRDCSRSFCHVCLLLPYPFPLEALLHKPTQSPGPSTTFSHQAGSADLAPFYGKPDRDETYYVVFSDRMPTVTVGIRPSARAICKQCRSRVVVSRACLPLPSALLHGGDHASVYM